MEVENIIRCQSESNYTNIRFVNDKNLLVLKMLVEFEELLEEFSFVQIHKTHLVNMKHVVAFVRSSGMIKLFNNELIPVARRRKENVMEKLKLSIRKKEIYN